MESIHPAYEILKMQAAHYDHKTKIIFDHTDENDKLIAQLELIKNIQSALNKDLDNDKAVDYSQNTQLKAWIAEMRKVDPNLIEEPAAKWSQGQRKHYIENLNSHVRVVTTKINSEFVQQREHFDRRNQIDKIAADMIKLYQEEGRSFVSNQVRGG